MPTQNTPEVMSRRFDGVANILEKLNISPQQITELLTHRSLDWEIVAHILRIELVDGRIPFPQAQLYERVATLLYRASILKEKQSTGYFVTEQFQTRNVFAIQRSEHLAVSPAKKAPVARVGSMRLKREVRLQELAQRSVAEVTAANNLALEYYSQLVVNLTQEQDRQIRRKRSRDIAPAMIEILYHEWLQATLHLQPADAPVAREVLNPTAIDNVILARTLIRRISELAQDDHYFEQALLSEARMVLGQSIHLRSESDFTKTDDMLNHRYAEIVRQPQPVEALLALAPASPLRKLQVIGGLDTMFMEASDAEGLRLLEARLKLRHANRIVRGVIYRPCASSGLGVEFTTTYGLRIQVDKAAGAEGFNERNGCCVIEDARGVIHIYQRLPVAHGAHEWAWLKIGTISTRKMFSGYRVLYRGSDEPVSRLNRMMSFEADKLKESNAGMVDLDASGKQSDGAIIVRIHRDVVEWPVVRAQSSGPGLVDGKLVSRPLVGLPRAQFPIVEE